MQKDNFSKQAATYSKFRPSYPQEVFDYIFSMVENQETVWDCGTGNGQLAVGLAKEFKQVFATDISQKQLDNATLASNIFYSIGSAENTVFANNSFDLITVAQAVHWFNFDKFYAEVQRLLKPKGILFLIGYATPRFEGGIQEKFQHFYTQTIGAYWDAERRHINSHYATIPFPFEEIQAPKFALHYTWELDTLEGYLNSWSSVQHYINKNKQNPVDAFITEVAPLWTAPQKVVFKKL